MSCIVNLTLVRATIMSSVRRTILAPGKVKETLQQPNFFHTLSIKIPAPGKFTKVSSGTLFQS